MWSVIFFIAVIYLIIQAFQVNVYVGVGAVLAVLAYGYFRWYAEFCTLRARAVYANDPEKAIVWFERAYKRGMTIAQKETFAYYLLREGETERAEEIYQQLLRQPLKADLRLKIRADYAVLMMKTGRIDEAIGELEEVTVNYINSTTYGTLGYLYLLKNNRRKAESYNKEAYEYNAQDPVILDNLIQLYIKLEQYNEAKKYADELIEKNPYFVEAYYDAAYVYMKLGDFEKALELVERGKQCRITFMSTIKEEELLQFEKSLQEKNSDIAHKLGTFLNTQQADEVETVYESDDETALENTWISDDYEDDNDPFI